MVSPVNQNWNATLGGIPITIVPSPPPLRTPQSEGDDPLVVGEYLPQESTRDVAQRDVAINLTDFRHGTGIVEWHGPEDEGGLMMAEGGYTHFRNGLMPSWLLGVKAPGLGLVSGGVTLTDVTVTDGRVFGSALYVITNGGHIIKFSNADPTQVAVFDPPLNTFGTATTCLHPGYVAKAIELFAMPADGFGVWNAGGTRLQILLVSAYKASTGKTRIYLYNALAAGTGWTASAEFTLGAAKMCAVYWEGRDGVGAPRLAIATDDATVRICTYGADPQAEASYTTPIIPGNPYYPITKLIASPSHLWIGKTDGWHDVNETRAANVTPYWADVATYSNAQVAALYDDGLFAARGFGLDRFDTRLGELVQQRLPGECGPGMGAQDGVPYALSQITGLAQHDGWLLMTAWNSINQTTYLGRAASRERLGMPSHPNPLVHYWSEQIIKPTGGVGQQVTYLTVTAPTRTASPVLGDRVPIVWMFTADVPTNAGFNFNLYYATLPTGSGPLALMASGGTFTCNPVARFYFTGQTWQDRIATKPVRRYDLVSEGTSSVGTIELLTRADGAAATITDPSTYTSQGTQNTTAVLASLTPSANVSGHVLTTQAVLTTTYPYTAPPILKTLSIRAAVRREVFKVDSIWVVLEKLHELVGGAPDIRDQDATFTALAALQSAGYQTYIDPLGATATVLVEQTARFVNAEVGDGVWRTLMHLELSRVSG